MSMQARELENFFKQHGSPEDAKIAAGLYAKAKAIEDIPPTSKVEIPVGVKTFFLALGVKPGEFYSASNLRARGILVNTGAEYTLGKTPFTPVTDKPQQIGIAILTPRDLGFTDSVPDEVLLNRAFARGFKYSPAEVGPILRDGYRDQPRGEVISIAMEKITGPYGHPEVFAVRHDGRGFWLTTSVVQPSNRWGPLAPLAFGFEVNEPMLPKAS